VSDEFLDLFVPMNLKPFNELAVSQIFSRAHLLPVETDKLDERGEQR
jgi:hypothetical protein